MAEVYLEQLSNVISRGISLLLSDPATIKSRLISVPSLYGFQGTGFFEGRLISGRIFFVR